MTKKCIVIGAYGQIILKEELLKHLKVKPGQELSYKLLPGNKLLLESIVAEQKRLRTEQINPTNYFELTDSASEKFLYYSPVYKIINKKQLH